MTGMIKKVTIIQKVTFRTRITFGYICPWMYKGIMLTFATTDPDFKMLSPIIPATKELFPLAVRPVIATSSPGCTDIFTLK